MSENLFYTYLTPDTEMTNPAAVSEITHYSLYSGLYSELATL